MPSPGHMESTNLRRALLAADLAYILVALPFAALEAASCTRQVALMEPLNVFSEEREIHCPTRIIRNHRQPPVAEGMTCYSAREC